MALHNMVNIVTHVLEAMICRNYILLLLISELFINQVSNTGSTTETLHFLIRERTNGVAVVLKSKIFNSQMIPQLFTVNCLNQMMSVISSHRFQIFR